MIQYSESNNQLLSRKGEQMGEQMGSGLQSCKVDEMLGAPVKVE